MIREKFSSPFSIKLLFTVRMAVHGLAINPLRTALTVLGVTIGVASVISLMGIGEGARIAVMQQFASLGTNVIKISVADPAYEFEPKIADELRQRVPSLIYTSPMVNVKTKMGWKRDRYDIELMGVNEQFMAIRDYTLIDGQFLSPFHIKLRSNVAVLGYNIGTSLNNGRSPVGRYIKLNGEDYQIIGVLGKKGTGKAENIDDKIIVPYTCAQKIADKRTIEEIWGKAESPENANLAVVQLGRIIRKMLHLNDPSSGSESPEQSSESNQENAEISDTPSETAESSELSAAEPDETGESSDKKPALDASGKTEVITITNMNEMVQEADKANRVMTLLLGGIAAVSLLVGGLGIMNIMLVAVSERTEEIGLRRALGAQKTDLLMQFLSEALLVSILGSIAGTVLGIGGTMLFDNYGFQTAVSLKAIGIASAVAISCGMVFGVYPALAAASIPPVIALRRQ